MAVALRREDLPDAAEDADRDEEPEILKGGHPPAEDDGHEAEGRREEREVEHDGAGLLGLGQPADLDRRSGAAERAEQRHQGPDSRSEIPAARRVEPRRCGESMIRTPMKPTATALHR